MADQHAPAETPRIWTHSVDYLARDDGKGLLNRGFWIHNLPRLMPLCRLRGHRPVVDGVTFSASHVHRERRSRWACCDRCGIRLQQPVDPDLEIGQPYTDPIPAAAIDPDVSGARGVLGGQVLLGAGHDGLSAEVKVGNAGSEHTLAAHLHLGRLFALYLHTERHGTWLQRRLNPTGYESRVTGISLDGGRLRWQVWASRDHSRSTDPWWQRGSFKLDPRDALLGPLRYSYEDVGDPQPGIVRMADGDDHPVILQLQRQTHGRARLAGRARTSWIVSWETSKVGGIPTRPGGRGGWGAAAETLADAIASGHDPADGRWVNAALAAIANRLADDRARHGFTLATQGEARHG